MSSRKWIKKPHLLFFSNTTASSVSHLFRRLILKRNNNNKKVWYVFYLEHNVQLNGVFVYWSVNCWKLGRKFNWKYLKNQEHNKCFSGRNSNSQAWGAKNDQPLKEQAMRKQTSRARLAALQTRWDKSIFVGFSSQTKKCFGNGATLVWLVHNARKPSFWSVSEMTSVVNGSRKNLS